jgi:aryl-alcohol dehydrogenase-like predicted oxidoreductase
MSGPPEGTRVEIADREGWSESWSRYNNEQTWQVIDALLAVAEAAGKTPAQVALNWLLQQPGVTAPIIGVRTLAHLENNLGATGWDLDEAQVARLTQAGDQPLPYPYEAIARAHLRR